MNIQIFGKSKCFDTKKAQRYFKERRIPFQNIDLLDKGMSQGELKSVAAAVGLAALIDSKHPDAALLQYLAYDEDKLEKLLEDPRLLKTPIVRNGRQPPWASARRSGKAGNKAGASAPAFSLPFHGRSGKNTLTNSRIFVKIAMYVKMFANSFG